MHFWLTRLPDPLLANPPFYDAAQKPVHVCVCVLLALNDAHSLPFTCPSRALIVLVARIPLMDFQFQNLWIFIRLANWTVLAFFFFLFWPFCRVYRHPFFPVHILYRLQSNLSPGQKLASSSIPNSISISCAALRLRLTLAHGPIVAHCCANAVDAGQVVSQPGQWEDIRRDREQLRFDHAQRQTLEAFY